MGWLRKIHAASLWPAAWLAGVLLVVAGCTPAPEPVTVRVADGSEALGGLDRVVVTFHEAGIHRQGQPRDEGWTDIPLTAPTIDLGAAGAAGTPVAVGTLGAGPYDRVRVEVESAYGERGGQRVPIRNMVEPIYLPAPLKGGLADITLELIVLPLLNPYAEERYAIYTKGVAVR